MAARLGFVFLFRLTVIAVLVAVANPLACAGQPTRTFSLDAAADVEILTATYRGGMQAYCPTYHLFGDGTLRIVLTNPAGRGEVIAEYTIQLSPDEIHSLLAPGIEAGLMEFDFAQKRKELQSRGRDIAIIADAGELYLHLTAANYRGPGNPQGGPMHHTIAMHAPSFVAQSRADVPEFQAVASIEKALEGFYARAKAEAEAKPR